MLSNNREQVEDIFQAALDQPPAEREKFLAEACRGDERLQTEIRRLLDSFKNSEDFLESAAADVIAGRQKKLRAGQKLGRYEIKSSIGAGGMGEVYLAKDTKLDRAVALKILPDAFAEDRERVRRFVQEAKAASALNHPNILTIYEIGSLENLHFIATEFIEGETLRARMKRVGNDAPLGLREMLDIAAQIAAALNAAHAAGIIHRDIKPENIMLREDGLVKVLDFGLVKLVEKTGEIISAEDETLAQINTAPGLVMGTVAYMSPEQTRGKSADARSDVWSLGVVLYEMYTARPPFIGETASDTIASILRNEPDLLQPNTPPELSRIIKKSLQKNAEERYQTANDFLQDLKNLQREREFAEEIERVNVSASSKTGNINFTSSENNVKNTSQVSAQNNFPSQVSSAKTVVGKDKRYNFLSTAILAMIILALGVGAYFAFFSAKTINAVAVLPFVNESGDANLDYLSDGLSERLIDSLSQLPQLKVISRTSSFKYRGKDVDLQQVAKTLGVEAVIVGRVIQRGDTLRVKADLIDVSNNKEIWGDEYVRKAADLQAVQENIVQTVSENLRLKLTGVQEQRLTKRATESAEAYQIYLNGLFYQRKGGKENTRKALDYYNQAIALDPNFALAYTQAAGVYNSFSGSGEMNPKEAIPKAKAAAQKALEIDETLAEAHSVLAVIKRFEWDWAGTETELQRAIELNPNLAAAHSNYAIYLSNMERHNEALAEIKRAQEIDPLWIGFRIAEGGILMSARRYDEAVQILQNIIQMNPDSGGAHEYLGYTYNAKKMYREAVAEFQTFYRIEGDTTADKAFLGFAYAKLGRRDEALAILNQLKTTNEYISQAELAILYAGLDDKESALAALERAFAEHDLQLQFLRVESHYDSLRSDARFQDLVRRVGLSR
ncbi:MAG: protein kinase [Acidobacteriota bacterium]|nr:protein kinase [Acidobacteriota bacterium]